MVQKAEKNIRGLGMKQNYHIEYEVKSFATELKNNAEEEDSRCLLAKIRQEMKDLKGLLEELTAIKKKGRDVS
jgi:hypothetical protein